jgi:hypothetical protein
MDSFCWWAGVQRIDLPATIRDPPNAFRRTGNLPTKADIAKLPTAKQIAVEVKKEMAENTITVEGLSGKKPAKRQPVKAEHPTTTPQISDHAQLVISQSPKTSTRPDAPIEIEVVVQTIAIFPSLKMVIQCDKPLVDGSVMNGGVRMMTSSGVLKEHPNIFVFTYESASPPFGPANPLIVDLWSKEPVVCSQVATV